MKCAYYHHVETDCATMCSPISHSLANTLGISTAPSSMSWRRHGNRNASCLTRQSGFPFWPASFGAKFRRVETIGHGVARVWVEEFLSWTWVGCGATDTPRLKMKNGQHLWTGANCFYSALISEIWLKSTVFVVWLKSTVDFNSMTEKYCCFFNSKKFRC
jgi:hypothetical protein